MPSDARQKRVEYMCRYCGLKQTRLKNVGRPMPGTCNRRGANQPHSWVKNREW